MHTSLSTLNRKSHFRNHFSYWFNFKSTHPTHMHAKKGTRVVLSTQLGHFLSVLEYVKWCLIQFEYADRSTLNKKANIFTCVIGKYLNQHGLNDTRDMPWSDIFPWWFRGNHGLSNISVTGILQLTIYQSNHDIAKLLITLGHGHLNHKTLNCGSCNLVISCRNISFLVLEYLMEIASSKPKAFLLKSYLTLEH